MNKTSYRTLIKAIVLGVSCFILGMCMVLFAHVLHVRSIAKNTDNSTSLIRENISGNNQESTTSEQEGSFTDIGFGDELDIQKTQFERMFEKGPHIAWNENDLAGYIDIHGNWVIGPEYPDALPFMEGKAAVKDSSTGLWGYIDTEGNWFMQPQFDRAFGFFEGTAVVSLGHDQYGLIDDKGNYIIEPVHKEVSYFKEGYALIKDTDHGLLDGCDLYHFIDRDGNICFKDYGFYEANLFENGKALVWSADASDGYRILDLDGNYTPLDMVFTEITSHSVYGYEAGYNGANGYLQVDGCVLKDNYGEYYMIDGEGHVISPPFDKLNSFSGDYATAAVKNEHGALIWGLVDRNFNWVIQPQYNSIGGVGDGYYWIEKDYDYHDTSISWDDLWAVIDSSGTEVLNGDAHDGKRFASLGAIYGWNDDSSIPIPAYENTDDPLKPRFGYMDHNYNVVIPFIYDGANEFSYDGSYAIVKYNGLYGVIDINGNWLIEPKFKSLTDNANGI